MAFLIAFSGACIGQVIGFSLFWFYSEWKDRRRSRARLARYMGEAQEHDDVM
jgi:hypothetical protein